MGKTRGIVRKLKPEPPPTTGGKEGREYKGMRGRNVDTQGKHFIHLCVCVSQLQRPVMTTGVSWRVVPDPRGGRVLWSTTTAARTTPRRGRASYLPRVARWTRF